MIRRWTTTRTWRIWASSSAVNDSAGWHEPLRVKSCDKKYQPLWNNLRLAEREMEDHVRTKGLSRQTVGRDGVVKRMWERYAVNKLWARELSEEATKAVQLETSSWQHESPYEEELELLRVSSDIRQAIKSGKATDWSELVKSDRLHAWTSAKLQERTTSGRASCSRFCRKSWIF